MAKQGLILTTALSAGLAMCFSIPSAVAQQHIDEPTLNPMLFGPDADKEERTAREEQKQEAEALKISLEQEEDEGTLDEPRLRPLMFGRPLEDDVDPTASSVRLKRDVDNRGFFSAFNFLIPEQTNLSIGVGPVYKPDYFGSDDYEWDVDPQVYVRFRNFLFLDDDGFDVALFGFSGFSFGPTMRLRGDRDESDNPALEGLGDVGETFEFGGFAATTFLDRFAFKAKVRHGIKTGHRGTVVDGYLTALIFRSDALSLSTTAQATWIGERVADTYFSVTPEQSANSSGRLPEFDAQAGIQDFGLSATAYINIRDRWSLNPYITYTYIYDDIARSPIIDLYGDRSQFRVGFHLMREFEFRMK